METTNLEKCIQLIGYWISENEKVIHEVLNPSINLNKDYIEPFSKELNLNLLAKETKEGKTDVLKYYVFEFFELQGFFRQYSDLLFTGVITFEQTKISHKKSDNEAKRYLNEFERYIVKSHELFNIMFEEIQICCLKYEIDFLTICQKLNFQTDIFDNSISTIIQKTNILENSANKNIKTVHFNSNEIEFFYLQSLQGIISKSDLADTQAKQILKFAERKHQKAIEYINELILKNPETTFEYWKERYNHYKESEKVIQWLTNSSNDNPNNEIKSLYPTKNNNKVDKLKIDQIALKYAYEELTITRKNSDKIAKEYGHNSGEKLFQRFTFYLKSANRKGRPTLCTPKKLDNKIKLIESVIELLPAAKQGRAKDEVKILKAIFENEYR